MSAQLSADTMKGHGLNKATVVDFYGLGKDGVPSEQPTRCMVGRVGNSYMLTSMTGEIHTWEFGAATKVYAAKVEPVEAPMTPAYQACDAVMVAGEPMWIIGRTQDAQGWLYEVRELGGDHESERFNVRESEMAPYVPTPRVDMVTATPVKVSELTQTYPPVPVLTDVDVDAIAAEMNGSATLALDTYVEITDDHGAVWTYSVTRFDEFWVGLCKVGSFRDGLNIRTDNFRAGLADGSVKVVEIVPTPTVGDVAAMTGDPVGWVNGLMAAREPVCQRCQTVKPLVDLPTQGSFIGAMTCPRNPVFRVCQGCAEVIWANRAEPDGAVWSNLWVLWLDGPTRDGRFSSGDDARECDVRLYLTEEELREARRELRPGYHVPMNGIILYDPNLNIPAQVGDRFMNTRYNTIYTVEVSEITRVALRPADGSALIWRQTGLFLEMKLSGELVAVHTPAVGDTVYRERSGHQGRITHTMSCGDLMVEFADKSWRRVTLGALLAEGYEVIPAVEVAQGEGMAQREADSLNAWLERECDIWAGTDTMRQPMRTKVNKRKRNQAKRSKRHSLKRGA